MDRAEFSKLLDLESVPLCATCKDMLQVWAESDPRSEGAGQLWTNFVRHFVECRMCYAMQHDQVAA